MEGAAVRTMAVGEFKAKCLAVLKDVDMTGQPLLVTRRGKPLARILPPEEPIEKEAPEAIFGCLRHMGAIHGDIASPEFTEEEWERMFHEKWDRFEAGPRE
jgi:prevent-host-death family protein